jgi:hypothetical protein
MEVKITAENMKKLSDNPINTYFEIRTEYRKILKWIKNYAKKGEKEIKIFEEIKASVIIFRLLKRRGFSVQEIQIVDQNCIHPSIYGYKISWN